MINNKNPDCYRRFMFWCCVGLLVSLFFNIPSARAANRIVTVGVYENAPKIFMSESGKPAGIFVDVIEHIARNEAWHIRYVPGTWIEGLNRLAKGEIDLMPDVAYTAGRAQSYSFHKVPVLSSWFQVYACKGSNIKSILDLRGKRITVLEHSVQEEAFSNLATGFDLFATLIPTPDYKNIFELVASGKADAAITNRFYGVMHAQRYGLEDTKVVFHPTLLFFAASQNTPQQLLDTIDNHILNLKSDPESAYYGSLKRWTSEEVPFKLPGWIKTLGWVMGVVLFMSIFGSIFLKHQVNERTHELRKINQEMEQRIVQRTAELATAMEKAQTADRIKSSFLATMSHELRTPLNSIIGFTGLILRERAGPLNDEQKKQLKMVQNSSRHLLALINDILDISKIEAGQLQLVYDNIDLCQMIDKVVQSTQPLADDKGLELGVDISPDVGTMVGDARRTEQILLNLLSNAIKFTETGSVRIICESDESRVAFKVADTGIGIKDDDIKTIFDSFRQVDSAISRKYEGTGLGLTISRKLVELMGGNVWVTSVWGAGSTFGFCLPKERTET
ncbi:MAG: transporter substrate-binding domain-containing protein [Deltaproteobacteria bacterium]|nr:transporter substrate-binding domain-containing protein [Deltaproteobacteria bacterium]